MINLPISMYVDFRKLECIFDEMTNSYKLYWFIGVFEEIKKGNREIKFREVVVQMLANAWYPVLKYKLNFGSQDKLDKAVKIINDKYIKDINIPKSKLYKELANIKTSEIDKLIAYFYKYVPYRLLEPFYREELNKKTDPIKNKIIEENSIGDDEVLYRINRKEKCIYINEQWFDYIYSNQNIISGWVKYKLIMFLQKRNSNIPAIPLKLDPPVYRELTIAKQYWKLVLDNSEFKDIYTGENFNSRTFKKYGNISIDHFIPWSFVLHEEMWNLIPTFKSVNSSKSDNLPNLIRYLDDYCETQYKALVCIKNIENSKKYIEDYYNICKTVNVKEIINITSDINKKEFISDLKNTILPLYQIAENQGYSDWTYTNNMYLLNKE